MHNLWQFDSYKKAGYKHVLLEIDSKVFMIEVNEVKSMMIKVAGYKTREDVITCLVDTPGKILSLWKSDDYTKRPTMTLVQQGAGSGKTYNLWKSLCMNEDNSTTILITKQHTARTNLYKELLEHEERGELHIIENVEHMAKNEKLKHTIITFTHKKSNFNCKIVIGTVDSLMCNIGDKLENSVGDVFQNIARGIFINGLAKVNGRSGYYLTRCVL